MSTEEQATEIVDQIREYTDSPYHGGGWSFDMDRDEAIKFVSTILKRVRHDLSRPTAEIPQDVKP
jgi:hypothetical protein